MKFLVALLLGILLGAGLFWYLTAGQERTDIREAQGTVSDGAVKVRDRIHDAVGDISFDTEAIKEELARSGKVVRQKAKQVGTVVADAAGNAKITAAIKGRFALDSRLSALSISVNTTDGLVTLSGTVASHEDIGHALKLALETEGVREVVSTLQVKQTK